MKRFLVATFFLFFAIAGYSQSNEIIGSWIFRDNNRTIQMFIKGNGVIEERTGNSTENIWDKTPRTGTYKFDSKGNLVITWADRSTESRLVKFKDHAKAVDFQFLDPKSKSKKTYLFLRIVDEEVIAN